MSDRNSSARDSASHDWQRWEMGSLERRAARRQPPARPAEQDQVKPQRREEDRQRLEALEQARREGFEQGRQEGIEKGHAEGLERGREQALEAFAQERDQRLEETLSPMADLVREFEGAANRLNDEIAYALVELALETGRQLAGRALELAPEHILDDIEKLMSEHPTLGGSPRICIHPEDLALVQAQLGTLLNDLGWRLSSDTALERGDCRLETDQREIDATREDRWERLRHAVGHGKH